MFQFQESNVIEKYKSGELRYNNSKELFDISWTTVGRILTKNNVEKRHPSLGRDIQSCPLFSGQVIDKRLYFLL